MEASILNSTKKVLGLDPGYTAFDLDILTAINSTFGILHSLGVGPEEGFMIEDETAQWEDFVNVPMGSMNMIKTYVWLRVRMAFDPPTTSFLIQATNDQIREYEWRLSVNRENDLPFPLVVGE